MMASLAAKSPGDEKEPERFSAQFVDPSMGYDPRTGDLKNVNNKLGRTNGVEPVKDDDREDLLTFEI